MADKKFRMGMLTVLLAFGLIMSGCENGTSGGGNDTAGKLTITGISSTYNGKYIFAISENGLMFAGNVDKQEVYAIKIADGKAVLPVYVPGDNDKPIPYTGSETLNLAIYILNAELFRGFDTAIAGVIAEVTFSNGAGSVNAPKFSTM
ncbi:MAG: hypothetical protein LBB22_02035 [Treponema sp.]|jgi:hypothetical protein|nr:hypothetical protein [Treponema sp.]